jgi:hypothetical protein
MSDVKIGDVFKLRCGTDVAVKNVNLQGGSVFIADKYGNSKSTFLKRLVCGAVEWRITPETTGFYADEHDVYSIKPLIRNSEDSGDKYYVYLVRHNDELLYVGKGFGNRYKHVNNGSSHVVGLNRLFFAGEKVDVSFHVKNASEYMALKMEEDCKDVPQEFHCAKDCSHLA